MSNNYNDQLPIVNSTDISVVNTSFSPVTYEKLFQSSPSNVNNIDVDTKDFISRYAKAHDIETPVKQAYDEKLANTKSKKDVETNKQTYIIIGIVSIILSFFLSLNHKNGSDKAVVSVLFFGGSIITLAQVIGKGNYNDTSKAKIARKIKAENYEILANFYNICLINARQDYQKHFDFLAINPTLEEVEQYLDQYKNNELLDIVQLELYLAAYNKFLSTRSTSNYLDNADLGVSIGIGFAFDFWELFS